MTVDKKYEKAIIALDKILTWAVYIFYPAMLVYMAAGRPASQWAEILPFVVVPGVSFLLVSAFRNIKNAPRPYEMPGAGEPIIKKNSPGKSFPSRHVFSIFIIAITAFVNWQWVGIAIALGGIVLAFCRVLGGVHFPRDVIAGAVCGIAMGEIGYWITAQLC